MRRIIYITCLLLAIVGSGCSSKKSDSSGGANNNGGSGNVPPVIDDPNAIINLGGADTTLNIVSKSVLDQYIGRSTNAPTDFKLTIRLGKVADYGSDSGFGGYVSISFKDNGQNYLDSFSSLWLGESNCGAYGDCNTVKDNVQNNRYNLLSTTYPELGGNVGYHGFFEDVRVPRLTPAWLVPPKGQIFGGAVILVIDSTDDQGDGQGPKIANGSVWFKNYQSSTGILPLTNCWFIAVGPFDCRAWTTSQNNDNPVKYPLNHKSSIYPNNGYVRLGTFTGLDIKKAFGI